MTYLFIGGPIDGQLRHLPPGDTAFTAAVANPARLKVDDSDRFLPVTKMTYVADVIISREGHKFDLMRPEHLTSTEVLKLLFKHYKGGKQ